MIVVAPEIVGLLVIILMLVLMVLRVPIAISMFVPAFIGIYYLKGSHVLLSVIESVIWKESINYLLVALPMFIFMGETLNKTGISFQLYEAFRSWFGKIRGGLAMATVGASAVFAAASGSSIATTASLGTIASKEMLENGYSKALTGGSVVAGGTLGILIPPSTFMIVYGTLANQHIAKLLIAGLVPGIVLAILYIICAYLFARLSPGSVSALSKTYTWKERLLALKSVFWILVVFVVVIGGMYIGLFGPTEAAGVGAFCAVVIALIKRKLNFKVMVEILSATLRVSGFAFAILLSAMTLNHLITISRLPAKLSTFLSGLDLPVVFVFLFIVLMYLVLGAFMDAMAAVAITIPIVLPVMDTLGFDLIWFGVILCILVEAGLITPPVGMNVFVLNGVAPSLGVNEIFKGSAAFLIPVMLLIVILYLVPDLALFLPNNM